MITDIGDTMNEKIKVLMMKAGMFPDDYLNEHWEKNKQASIQGIQRELRLHRHERKISHLQTKDKNAGWNMTANAPALDSDSYTVLL